MNVNVDEYMRGYRKGQKQMAELLHSWINDETNKDLINLEMITRFLEMAMKESDSHD